MLQCSWIWWFIFQKHILLHCGTGIVKFVIISSQCTPPIFFFSNNFKQISIFSKAQFGVKYMAFELCDGEQWFMKKEKKTVRGIKKLT